MKYNFTGGSPARVTLQILAASALFTGLTVLQDANTVIELYRGAAFFVLGMVLFVLREHVSNGDYFKEFDKHIEDKYVKGEDEDDEPDGYG